ncbi:cytokine receptor family member B16 precursor [Silurus asotus]|uniref:Cytokine receptor family member B16 n=1 Tax=Silurus asotus TaxID=30991 RepID=A0AAD5A342_SILAS|nr:cytokine receptor family member B16 precursor [Silurus asotus]
MRNFLKTVTSAYLIFSLSHAALLPASLNIWIQSENMRHILKWSSLQETCPFVNYTVKYQGEFEHMQNTWLDAHSCNEIVHNECDLTLDLSSDSDYNIRVLARCGDSTLWTQLPETFNRRDTVLLAPDMSVKLNRGRIEGYFSELPNHINVNVRIWKKGDEKNAFVKEITDQKFHHDVQQGDEGIYCVTAEVTLDITNRSNSTREHCIPVWAELRRSKQLPSQKTTCCIKGSGFQSLQNSKHSFIDVNPTATSWCRFSTKHCFSRRSRDFFKKRFGATRQSDDLQDKS